MTPRSAPSRRCPGRQPRTSAARDSDPAGKGEALWRSLAATSGDIVVFVDSDLVNPHPMFVPWLVGRCSSATAFTWSKASTDGPDGREADGVDDADGTAGSTGAGGLPSWQPGRCWRRCGPSWLHIAAAGRRIRGYPGIVDVAAVRAGVRRGDRPADRHLRPVGLDAIAQVNMGVRAHRNRPLAELGAMSRQVIATCSRGADSDSGIG